MCLLHFSDQVFLYLSLDTQFPHFTKQLLPILKQLRHLMVFSYPENICQSAAAL